MESQRTTEIKVGLFLIIATIVGVVIIVVIGSSRQIFDKQVALYSYFKDVSGLQEGSQVRLAGMKIGIVERIWIPSKEELKALNAPLLAKLQQTADEDEQKKLKKQIEENTKKLKVKLKVRENMLFRIRNDSTASVDSSGLLGYSVVNISIGLGDSSIEANGRLRAKSSKGLKDYMGEVQKVLDRVKSIAVSIDMIVKQYTDPKLSRDVQSIVNSVASLLKRTKTGPGLLHDLVYSRRISRSIRSTLTEISRTGRNITNTTGQVNRFLAKIRRPGTFTHRLLISRKGQRLVRNVERLVGTSNRTLLATNKILNAPQKKGTLLNELLYSKKNSRLLTNLVRASADVQKIIKDIRAGKGSLGALLNDPTAFEDFKTILGQVKRSRVFRGLIRFIIKRDDSEKGGRVTKP